MRARTVPPKSSSPAAFAAAWARQHTAYTGLLVVKAPARKGRWGWGTTVRATTFYAAGGAAAQRRSARDHSELSGLTYSNHFHNGLCESCGQLWREPVLRRVWNDTGWLIACPGCSAAHQLRTRDDYPAPSRHSHLARHRLAELPVTTLVLDSSFRLGEARA